MKILLQRSNNSKVLVDDEIVGEINKGLVLLVCLENGDTKEVVIKAVNKVLALRIFEDENDKMNLNILDYGGEILAISQFTLSWNGKKGNRPSFDNSMAPQSARVLFRIFTDELSKKVKVETGRFGAHMNVQINNNGPVTFFLEF